jgi:hypothetical protein
MTTLNLQVAAGADDGVQNSAGTMLISDAYNGVTASSAWFGWRWQDALITPGSTIDAAILQIYVSSTTYDDVHLDLYCEDNANPSELTTTDNDISDRARTIANASWDANGVGTGFQSSPDLAGPVQEVVNLPAWVSGNPLFVAGDCTTGINLAVRHYEYSGNTSGAKLDIDYTPPAAAGQPMALRGQAVPGLRPWARAGRL